MADLLLSYVYHQGHVGMYPDLTRGINGGIPQRANLSAHLQKFRRDFAALVPDPDYRGYCLLDFEQFRADWNSTPDAYRNASVQAAGGNASRWMACACRMACACSFHCSSGKISSSRPAASDSSS